MDQPWARKRSVDEVPTSVAVALSNFCRRAGAVAAPADVREALSTLSPEEDFRVQTFTEGELPVRPLGPYAVVDVLSGISPALAAQREACGYYQLLKSFLDARQGPSAVSAAGPFLPMPSRPPERPERPADAHAESGASTPPPETSPTPTISSRIAPKRRVAGAAGPTAAPAPRGRFAQLPSEQPSVEALSGEQLANLLAQHGHRPALLQALGLARDLGHQVLDRALDRAGLLEGATRLERELLLSTLEEQRGALGRTAWALRVRPSELVAWAKRLGLTEEVDRIRDRFRREALQPVHWTARLDLLGKRKYLEDLGVSGDFERSVSEDLRRALEATPGVADERTALLANRLGVSPEALRRSLVRLGLSPATTSSISPPPL